MIRRSKPVTVQGLLALGLLLAAMSLPAPAAQRPITVYITDFGINQWHDQLRLGDDFTHATNQVLPQIDRRGQILVPMPADRELATLSDEELTQRIAHVVQDRLRAAIHSPQPVTTFEIQLVQNINTAGYFDDQRQDQVDQFGAAAYNAIGRVFAQLQTANIAVASYAVVGSNGTTVLAANADRLTRQGTTYLQGIDLFDGRAFLTPVQDLIDTVRPERVRIFATRGDWPAPYTPFGFRSLGNFDTLAALKDRNPGLTTYLLTPKVPIPNPLVSHVAGMARHEMLFTVEEYLGNGQMRASQNQSLVPRSFRPTAARDGPIRFRIF